MIKKIIEGQATIKIDEAEIVSKDLEAFYNPKMALNRDFSIALIKAVGRKEINIGLPLAGTGVRGIRMLMEIPEYINNMSMNDMDEKAVSYIKENLKLNKLDKKEKVIITNLEANKFLMDSFGCDYIDIDPFGSPNFLLDSSIKYISRKGILAVSATDTSALAGTYPKTCKRKYFANSVICPQKHELGIRILARKVQLMGLQNDKILEPIFSYHFEHYYRIFFKITKSRDEASAMYDKLQTYHHNCKKCAYQFSDENKIHKCPKCGYKIIPAGPMYDGPLNNKIIIDKLLLDEKIPKEGIKILERIKEELPLQEIVGSYDSHEICRRHKFRSQKVTETKEKLIAKKYETVICATNRTAMKTTAPYEEIIKILTKREEDIN